MHHTTVLMIVLLILPLASRPLLATPADTSCGIIWDAPILLSDTNYNSYSPKIALSGDDTVHITWENSFGQMRLPYVRSTSGGETFENVRELLPDSLSFPFNATWIQIVASQNRVFIFFENAAPGNDPVWMIQSSNYGSNWSSGRAISVEPAGEIRSAGLSNDLLGVVYAPQGSKKILRSTDGGQTWTRTNEGLNYFARVALSAGGVLHLVQIGVVGNTRETEYRRSHDLGDTWVQQTLLSTVDGFGSLDPIVAASTTPGDTTVIAAWRDPKYGCIGLVGCSIIARPGTSGTDSTRWIPGTCSH